jgi:hypothetical protein
VTSLPRLGACALLLSGVACHGPTSASPADPPALSPPTATAHGRPRLVVSVVLDQLGSDTLLDLEPLLDPDGFFAEVLREGRLYEHVVYPYASTMTAPGHACLYSGAPPSRSGVTSNYKLAPGGKRVGIIDDGVHRVLGASSGCASPTVLRVDTVADALKHATGGKGKVVSLSLKDRSAVLPGGKRPDLALWFDTKSRIFTTSEFYASALPPWLTAYERDHPVRTDVRWSVDDPASLEARLGPDAGLGEGDYFGLGTTFPHDLARIADPDDRAEAWVLTPQSTDALLALAVKSSEELGLGADDVPDLLAISISGTDYTGHVFGPRSWEYADHLRHCDRALKQLFDAFRKRTTVAILVTSDHGAAPLPEQRSDAGTAGRLDLDARVKDLESAAAQVAGPGTWIAGVADPYVVLTDAARAHPASARIRSAVVRALEADPGVLLAYDVRSKEPPRADPDVARAILESIHPEASGDIFVVPKAFTVVENRMTDRAGTNHGTPWEYDTNVPVLLIAPGVTPRRHPERHSALEVASTLAALLGVPPPLGKDAAGPLPGVVAASEVNRAAAAVTSREPGRTR